MAARVLFFKTSFCSAFIYPTLFTATRSVYQRKYDSISVWK